MSQVKFITRNLHENDCNFISSLCGQLGYPSTESEVMIRIKDIIKRENHQVFVAETIDKKVVGWVHVHICPLLECDLMAEIGGLVVDRDYRRMGIGTELMKHAEDWAKSKGYSMVNLRSNVIRKKAHIFYESMGYVKIKQSYTFRKII